mgnify:CR=1 FL=1
MMNFKHLLKKMMMALAVLFCSVVTANAATITYQLTTHVDGRTITGTADLASGAALEANMPQALWRGYTTYKYYSDAALTQEITTVQDGVTTVYVDYVFDPPFTVSEDGQDAVWHYLKHQPGVNPSRFFYYSEYHGKYYQQYGSDDAFWQKQNLTTGNMTLKTKENAQWSFYGDAYCLNLKFNDVNNIESNDFMVCKITTRTIFGRVTYTYQLVTGAKMMPGWQLYINDAINGGFSLGLPEDTHINQLIWLYDYADAGDIHNLSNESDCGRSSQNHITNTDSQGQGWDECLCYAFLATPASESSSSFDPWHVTYKIQKADGTWYNDIVEQKHSNDLTPSFPPEAFTPVEGYEYDYFYLDADFTEKCPDGYTMPNDQNTVLYIKEIAPVEEDITIERNLTKDRWITLVLPYTVKDVSNINGIKGEALEYVSLSVDRESYWSEATLSFKTVETMEANKPYLFRAVEFADGADYGTLKVYEGPESGKPVERDIIPVNHDDNFINVEMRGTYEGKTLDVAPYSEPKGYEYIYFYFGYEPNAAVPYNFYVVDEDTVKINPFLCYFTVTYNGPKDEATGAKGVRLSFNQDVTGISKVSTVEDGDGKVYNLNGQQVSGSLSKGIYIVNGKKVLVK